MLHQANSLFFGRNADGSIRILKLNQPPADWPKIGWSYPQETVLDVNIPPRQWASIVDSLARFSSDHNDTDFSKDPT